MSLIRHVPLLHPTNLHDSIMGPNGSLQGGSASVDTTAPLGSGMKFEKLFIPYADGSDTLYNEFSIAFWFRPYTYSGSYGDTSLASSWHHIFHIRSKGPSNQAETLRFACNCGTNYTLFGNNVFTNNSGFSTLALTSTNCPLNTWTHVIFTIESDVNGTIGKLYLNGNYINSQTFSNYKNGAICNQTFEIGNTAIGYGLSDLRIYNHILSDYEIAELQKRPLLHYSFDN